MQSPESPMNRAFHGFWQQKRAGTKPAQVGADVHNGLETREKKALCQELGLTKNNKDADAVKGKLALDCIVAFKRLEKT